MSMGMKAQFDVSACSLPYSSRIGDACRPTIQTDGTCVLVKIMLSMLALLDALSIAGMCECSHLWLTEGSKLCFLGPHFVMQLRYSIRHKRVVHCGRKVSACLRQADWISIHVFSCVR